MTTVQDGLRSIMQCVYMQFHVTRKFFMLNPTTQRRILDGTFSMNIFVFIILIYIGNMYIYIYIIIINDLYSTLNGAEEFKILYYDVYIKGPGSTMSPSSPFFKFNNQMQSKHLVPTYT